jgi:hypothetical protein
MARRTNHESEPVQLLKRLPFVRELNYVATPNAQDSGYDGKIDIRTPTGRFQLLVQAKRSFLTRTDVNQFLAWVQHARTGRPHKIILLARHIPRPVADRLLEAQVNFADDAGNIHLELGDRYNWTVVGKPTLEPLSERRPTTAAQLQLLFQFATYPESVNWPVRRLETAAGISKSKVAQARKELVAKGLLTSRGKAYQLGQKDLLSGCLTSGYAQVLRPKLLVGRFRFPEKTTEQFLSRLRNQAPSSLRYALTGGPAVDLLQHIYRGPESPIFIQPFSRHVAQGLRLLPDSGGPLTLLRAFGEVVFWQERENHMIAPPWLIYAELLNGDDPRAHEAAREILL